MRVVGTIEARMGSTRLPGKSMMEIYPGISLLGAVVTRFKMCKTLTGVWVATTSETADDAIAQWCIDNDVNFFRGSENDVLDRVVKTALEAQADAIVQMGGDSAYLDCELIGQMVQLFKDSDCDFLANDLELTYPLGIYAHIVRVASLVELNERANLSIQDREDVVRYIWEHPREYRITNIPAPPDLHYPELRLTIDYPEDMEQARTIYARFKGPGFNTKDLIALYREEPEIFEKTKNLVQHSAAFLRTNNE